MKKIGGVIIAIIAIFLLLGPFRQPIVDGIKGWRANDTEEDFAVTTAAAQTTANVTLSYDLYQAATAEVIEITSTDGTDTPVSSTYTEATKKLLIAGLNDDASRTLTVEYWAETDDDTMRIIGPFVGFLIFGGIIFGIVWSVWKH